VFWHFPPPPLTHFPKFIFPLLTDIIPYPPKFPYKFGKLLSPSSHLIPSQQKISLFLLAFHLGFEVWSLTHHHQRRGSIARGKILRFEPSNCNQITSSPFFVKFFEDVNCLGFCQRVQEIRYHEHLTSIFPLALKEDKIIIVGTDFMFSVDTISQATGIPNHGEN